MAEQQNFSECVAQHLPFLNRVVWGLTRGDEMADDIVQQTILKALLHADQFRFQSTVKTWLSSIAINEVYQVYRSKWRRCAVSLRTEDGNADRYVAELPKNTYEVKEQAALVRDAVSRLPPPYRSVVELCDFEHLPLKEAARKLGLTVHAVKSRRHRALQKLRPLVAHLKVKSPRASR
jgi:RNA polymerase sigma-70 factor (ECF subfamily)